MWQYTGQQRPPFAQTPQPGQESVWDYPRPPALRRCEQLIRVERLEHGGQLLAQSVLGWRVCETASPPTVYIPPQQVDFDQLVPLSGQSFCEWKGRAVYWGLKEAADDADAAPVAWAYPHPTPAFAALKDFLCFYPARVACFLDGERVRPQPGRFYRTHRKTPSFRSGI